MAEWDVVSHEPASTGDPWAVVSHESQTPREYDPVPATGVPKGFYAVTGDDGKQTLRREAGFYDVMRALGDIPGVGMAERAVQGGARLAGKVGAGIAGLFGADPNEIRGTVNQYTELPPSRDPLVQGSEAFGEGTQNFLNETGIQKAHDKFVGNLSPLMRGNVEVAEEAAPEIAALLGLRSLVPEAAPVQNIARTPAEVAKEAGYTGLHTKADLSSPGNQAITDTLISRDAGIVPGQRPSVASLENAHRVGPGRVYRAVEDALPERLTMRNDPLVDDLQNLPKQVSQLPRSPDVEALQETMLSQPEFTRDELFANIREARERAKVHWKSDDPDKAALGDAYHSLANAYEDFAGRQLDAAQSPISLADWQAARTQMAKNYQAQGALRGPQGSEHFNPQAYARIMERDPHLLTGDAAVVGHVAGALPTELPPGVMPGVSEAAEKSLGYVPVAGPLIRAKLEQLRLRGRPEAAAGAPSNPALSYFFDQGRMPEGWNRVPVEPQIAGLLPSPSMVNAGGGATTPSALEALGLTPDVQAAGAAHPAAARLAALREQLASAPERPAEPVDFQPPQKWGDFSIAAPQSTPVDSSRLQSNDVIPFEDVLEHGGTQRKPIGAPAASRAPGRIAKSPAQPNVRTPPGAPELATAPPPGPSPAQVAFRNKLAADRLRKVAGDLRLEGPGGATGDPIERARAALERQRRGYARGGLAHAFP